MDLFTRASQEVHKKFTRSSRELHEKFTRSSQVVHEKVKQMNRLPNEDLSSSQIAKFLNVSRKTVTSYYEKVREAYYWLL
ncbi:MAG: hypothetical protein ACKPKO_61065, partial [Candidatus Fonsibacter sp.]